MKMKNGIRYLVLLLCLVLALGVFAACNKPGEGGATSGDSGSGEGTPAPDVTDAPENMIAINIADYALYISETAGNAESAAAGMLLASVQEKLGADFRYMGSDFVTNEAEIDPNAYEILIGNTNRPESSDALADLEGKVGFVVKKIGNIRGHASVYF